MTDGEAAARLARARAAGRPVGRTASPPSCAPAGPSPSSRPPSTSPAPPTERRSTAALARLAAGEYHWMTRHERDDGRRAVRAPGRIPEQHPGRGGRRDDRRRARRPPATASTSCRAATTPRAGCSPSGPTRPAAPSTLRILALRSDIAKPVLTDGLRAAGPRRRRPSSPTAPSASRSRPRSSRTWPPASSTRSSSPPAAWRTRSPCRSASCRRAPCIACIGPRTAVDAEAAGLRVDLVARERSSESLIDTLEELAVHRHERDQDHAQEQGPLA